VYDEYEVEDAFDDEGRLISEDFWYLIRVANNTAFKLKKELEPTTPCRASGFAGSSPAANDF
jgi:hypothetical protein